MLINFIKVVHWVISMNKLTKERLTFVIIEDEDILTLTEITF